MDKYNEIAELYLNALYPNPKDKTQIKDIFEKIITLPAERIGPQGYVSLLNEIIEAGYTDDFTDVAIKLAQAVKHHNKAAIKPTQDFSYVQDKIYLDRDDILAICDNVLNARDKAFILGSFEGLCGHVFEEMLEIREEDIIEDGDTPGIFIRSRGEVFTASPELMQFFKDAAKEKQYFFFNKRKGKEFLDLTDNGTVLKRQSRVDSMASEYRLVHQNLIKIGVSLGFAGPISFRHIRNCGRKYYLEELCDKMEEPDYENALKKSAAIRDAYFKRFGLSSYSSLAKMMSPITKLIARPE